MSEDRSRTKGRIVRTVAVATLAMSCIAHAADKPAPSDWPIASRDYAGWRFADLGDINAGNVANLKVAFTFSTGMVRGHEAAPSERVQQRWLDACAERVVRVTYPRDVAIQVEGRVEWPPTRIRESNPRLLGHERRAEVVRMAAE